MFKTQSGKKTLKITLHVQLKMRTYCVKEKRETESLNPQYVRTKNGRLMLKSTCASCGITKSKFVKRGGFAPSNHPEGSKGMESLEGGFLAEALFPAVGSLLYNTGRLGLSKAVKSDAARSMMKNYAQKFINQGIDNVTTDLSKKLRPKIGQGLDIHNAILKVAPKKGFVMPGHNYTGPGNPLHKQLKHDDQGNILEIYQQPTGKSDAVAMQHDVDYTICSNKPKSEQVKCKNEADRKMVKSLDSIPWSQRQWGHAMARNAIAAKAKLGMGVKKKTGKKN